MVQRKKAGAKGAASAKKTSGKPVKKVSKSTKAQKPVAKKPVPKKAATVKKPAPKAIAVVKKPVKSKPKAVVVAPKPKSKTPPAKPVVVPVKPLAKVVSINQAKSKKAAVAAAATAVETPKVVSKTGKVHYKAEVRESSVGVAPHTVMGFAPYHLKEHEEYMNAPQREHLGKILETWKQELMEEVDRVKSQMQDEAANFPDPNDRATQEEFNLALRARDRERKLIRKIDETLERIKNDDYGYCDACGIEIGLRRLEARPTATLCIDCKTLDEIKEKQMGE